MLFFFFLTSGKGYGREDKRTQANEKKGQDKGTLFLNVMKDHHLDRRLCKLIAAKVLFQLIHTLS